MSLEAQDDLKTYIRCMREGHTAACYRIECKYALDGYHPELVTIGLQAVANDLDAQTEINTYLEELEASR